MSSKTINKPVFEFGNYTIVEKIEAKDESTNTFSKYINELEHQSPIVRNSRLQRSRFNNPKLIFNYVTPPGDLVQHPELLPDFKQKLRAQSLGSKLHQQKHKNNSPSAAEGGIFESIRKELVSSVLKKQEKLSESQMKARTISEHQKQNNSDSALIILGQSEESKILDRVHLTPKKKHSNLSRYSQSSQKRLGINPQDDLSRMVADKLKR